MRGHANRRVEPRLRVRGGVKSVGGNEVKGGRKKERQRERRGGGARLYLISAKVSIEQKVQQAGSTVKP